MSSNAGKLRKSQASSQRQQVPSMHWLFRSNIPRRRASYIAPDIRKRNFFGMGEIIGVLTNVSRGCMHSYVRLNFVYSQRKPCAR